MLIIKLTHTAKNAVYVGMNFHTRTGNVKINHFNYTVVSQIQAITYLALKNAQNVIDLASQ